MAGVAADSVVIDIEARVANAQTAVTNYGKTFDNSMSQVERSANRAETAIQRQSTAVVTSSGAAANATRNLGRQVSDIGVGLATGQSPMLVLAQQAPQLADALADTGGKAARVAAFFAGPWGAAMLAAGSALGILVGKMLEGEASAESLVAKMVDQARQAQATAAAQDVFAQTIEGATQATNDLDEALGRAIQSEEQAARAALAAAEAQRVANIQVRQRIVNQLELAEANLKTARSVALDPSNGFTPEERFGALGAGGQYERELERARKDLAQANLNLAKSERQIISARIPVLDLKAAARSDENAAATLRHSRALDRLREEYKRTGDAAAYENGVVAANQQLKRDEQVISDRASAGKRAETEARRRNREALREEAKAARELERAQRELEASLESIQGRFDAPAAAAAKYRGELEQISKLARAGLIDPGQEILYSFRAALEHSDRLVDNYERLLKRPPESTFYRDLGIDVEGDYARMTAEEERRRAAAQDLRIETDLIDMERERDKIFTLADIFENAFNNGSKGIFEQFKYEALRALAIILAEAVTGKSVAGSAQSLFGGGGVGFFSAITSLFTGGRASGGYVAPGQTYRINEGASPGRVEGLRLQGQGATVIPLGQMNLAKPQATANSTATVRLELSGDIDARIVSVSGPLMVETVRAAAPSIRNGAVAETIATLGRRSL